MFCFSYMKIQEEIRSRWSSRKTMNKQWVRSSEPANSGAAINRTNLQPPNEYRNNQMTLPDDPLLLTVTLALIFFHQTFIIIKKFLFQTIFNNFWEIQMKYEQFFNDFLELVRN